MPIDPKRALAAELPTTTATWSHDDIILYHLGLGAGGEPGDEHELEYVYEKNLKVLPSFAVIPVRQALSRLHTIPGLTFDARLMLHGEQEIEIRRPLPVAATVTTETRLAGLYDKGKAALAVLETRSSDNTGELMFVNRFSLFLRGAGGFGGEPGPPADTQDPQRRPDVVAESPTLRQQALLYRLSGDKNRLHADPRVAEKAGFRRPILHGLCTYGIVCKAVVDNMLGGDPSRVAGYRARFAGVVFPGETLVTAMWRDGDRILVEATVRERTDATVISNAAITLV